MEFKLRFYETDRYGEAEWCNPEWCDIPGAYCTEEWCEEREPLRQKFITHKVTVDKQVYKRTEQALDELMPIAFTKVGRNHRREGDYWVRERARRVWKLMLPDDLMSFRWLMLRHPHGDGPDWIDMEWCVKVRECWLEAKQDWYPD